jgi:hypothetical protein
MRKRLMKIIHFSKKSAILIIGALVLLVILLFLFLQLKQLETFERLNHNLIAGEVRLYLDEDELVRRLGEGSYVEGFGGHRREYSQLQIRTGIAGDSDNDFYKKVSQIEFSNPDYAVYGIKTGSPMKDAEDKSI